MGGRWRDYLWVAVVLCALAFIVIRLTKRLKGKVHPSLLSTSD